nr:MAG TPA: hypothetical protein [Caudoviricetes sp.]
MTVGQLKKALERYSDDMPVKIATGFHIESLKDVSWGVDVNTNIYSVWLCGRQEKRRKK